MNKEAYNEFEQIINQFPGHLFSHIYPNGLKVTLWNDNPKWTNSLWHSKRDNINNPGQSLKECNASTFQEVLDDLDLDDISKQQLLEAAREQQKK